MEHNTENLEHFSLSQSEEISEEDKPVYSERPIGQRIFSWLLIAVVLFGFLGSCYWMAMYGRI